MRNFVYLLLLGVILITIAIVVRSGMFARKDPGRPTVNGNEDRGCAISAKRVGIGRERSCVGTGLG